MLEFARLEVFVAVLWRAGLPLPSRALPRETLATTLVNAADELLVRGNKTGFAPASITNIYDFNRDRRVSASDELTARYCSTTAETALRLIDLRGGAQAL